MVRNSLKYVAAKHMKEVAGDLKNIYQFLTVNAAERALTDFAKKWDTNYPAISQSWRSHWEHLITIFDYPDEIRNVIYTTNAIELLNSVIRKAIRNRKIFSHDDSAMKIVYLAVIRASEKLGNAHSKLETCSQSIWYRIRGQIPSNLHISYTKFLQALLVYENDCERRTFPQRTPLRRYFTR